MRLPLSIVGALLAAGAAAGVATAQTSPADAPPTQANAPTRHLSRIDRLAILLDLTDTQKLQVQQVLQEEHQQMRTYWQQQKSSGAKPDFQQMRTERRQLRQQTMTKLQALLSADQFKKLQVLMAPPHGRRWHHGPPPPGDQGPSGGSGSSSSPG